MAKEVAINLKASDASELRVPPKPSAETINQRGQSGGRGPEGARVVLSNLSLVIGGSFLC